MNNNLIQWRDPEDLSKGFIIDLENGSAAQVFSGIYMRPEELISAFADCFLLMRFTPEEADSMAHELYEQTRSQLDAMIDRLRATPFARIPTTHHIQ
ncbi:hypothetical protein [Pantoea septica]|uniref:hypothetical protein n=1 Tax=Pantoea septica TaxID=472695 RepID=UPI0023F1753B|nr:hypothetical protein [Pantoea septica]